MDNGLQCFTATCCCGAACDDDEYDKRKRWLQWSRGVPILLVLTLILSGGKYPADQDEEYLFPQPFPMAAFFTAIAFFFCLLAPFAQAVCCPGPHNEDIFTDKQCTGNLASLVMSRSCFRVGVSMSDI